MSKFQEILKTKNRRIVSTKESLKDVEPYFNSTDWDEITNIFAKAIKRKGLTKEEVRELTDKLLDE